MTIKLISCVGIDYDIALLPHFIEHYSKLDIDTFHFIIHSKSQFNLNEFYNTNINLRLDKWVGKFDGVTKTNKLNNIIEKTKEDYIVLADVDEFQIWDKPLKSYNKAVWGTLQDRESKDKSLTEVKPGNLEEQFPLITERTLWKDLDKPCLFPSSDRLLSPHHLEINKNPKKDLIKVNHYRWVKGRLEKSIERKSIYKELNKKGYKLEKGPWNKIPNWESDHIIGAYTKKHLI
jgi:hypothetical protein